MRAVALPTFDAYADLRRQLEEAAVYGGDPGQRALAIRRMRGQIDGLVGYADSLLQEVELEREADATTPIAEVAIVRENADLREELIRRGMATAEQLDEAGVISHEALDEAAAEGRLEEAAVGALGMLSNHGGGLGALGKWLEKLHPRGEHGKFAKKPGGNVVPIKGNNPVETDSARGITKARVASGKSKGKSVYATPPVKPSEVAVQSREGLPPGGRPAGMSPKQAAQERERTREVGRAQRGSPQTEEQKAAATEKDRAKRQESMTKRVDKAVTTGVKEGGGGGDQEFNSAGKVSQKALLDYVKNTLTTPSTADAHSETNADGTRTYHADRKQLHDAIIDVLMRTPNDDRSLSASNPYLPSQDTPSVLFMGGGYAAGKSSTRKILQARDEVPQDALTIDPDQIKSMLPEFALTATHDPEANLRVYEEAWDVAQELQRQAQEKKLNVIVDGITNSGADEVYGRVQGFKDAGYGDAKIAYVDVPTDVALQRAGARAQRAQEKAAAGDPSAASDMRHIPEPIMRAVHRDVAATIPQVMNDQRKNDLGVSISVYDGQSNALEVARTDPGGEVQVSHDPAYKRLQDKGGETIGGVDAPESQTDPGGPESRLPQQHDSYFNTDKADQTIPLEKLRPTKPPESQPKSVDNAHSFMSQAAAGTKDKRDPISVQDNGDGTYSVQDGNATYGAAVRNGWSDLPVQIKGGVKTPSPPPPPERESEVKDALQGMLTDEEKQTPIDAPPNEGVTDEASAWEAAQRTKTAYDELMTGVGEALGAQMHVMEADGNDGDAVVKEFDGIVSEVGKDPTAARVIVAPLKGKSSAQRKAAKKGGDWSKVQDIVRGTVLVGSPGDIPGALDAVRTAAQQNGWTISAVENRMTAIDGAINSPGPTASGYSDFNVKLQTPDGIQTELQFNTGPMFDAKQGDGHKLYEQERAITEQQKQRSLPLNSKQLIERDKLRTQQAQLYRDAWLASLDITPHG